MLLHGRVRLVERLRLRPPGLSRISAGMRAMRRQCSRRSQTTDPLAAHDGTCMHVAVSCTFRELVRLEGLVMLVDVLQDPRVGAVAVIVECL